MAEKVSYWHEGRALWIDQRVGPTIARKFLNGKVPNLSHPIEGQQPCKFTEGEQIIIEQHRFWITISKVRPRAGRWQVEYILADHRPVLMGKKTGYTHDARKAMRADYTDPEGDRHDELEAVEDIEKHPQDERREVAARTRRAKIEDLKGEREAQQRRLLRTDSEISKRLIPRMIERLDREIAEMEDSELEKAA
jgi:hypothetical protein